MSILQFFSIIWAYRKLVLATTLVCFVVATAVVELVPPRYDAQSRVMLDVIKPDPVTGQMMNTAYMKAYTRTQIQLIKDLQVARRVVDDLKWANNKEMKKEYRERKTGHDLDFNRWAAQQIVDGADAQLISGSNILEITYSADTPDRAKVVADALSKAYIDMTLQSRRENAQRNAQWYENQAEKVRGVLFKAEADKSALERSSGIVLQDDKSDIDNARLAALAGQGSAPVIASPSAAASQSAIQLAQLDAEIAETAKSLGPNHPTLQAMKIKRNLLAQQVAAERNTAGSAAAAAASAAQATAGMLEQQKAKVMSQRETVEKLRLMQDEVDLRRDQYNKALVRAAQLRQEAEVLDSGVIPLASAITPTEPTFPQKGLTMGVSVPLGAVLGIGIALLLELIGRRIRSAHDLQTVVDAPVLAVLQDRTGRRRVRPQLPRFLARRRAPAARAA